MIRKNEGNYKLSQQSLKYMRTRDSIFLFIFLAIIVFCVGLKYIYSWDSWWNSYTVILIISLLFILSSLIEIIIVDKYRQKNWELLLEKNYIQLTQGGILKKSRKVLPINKIQHIDIIENPILRKYSLFSLKISTIAYTHELPALTQNQIDQIHGFLNESLSLMDKSSVNIT